MARRIQIETGKCLATFTGDAAITCVAVARDDLYAAGSANGTIHILELRGRARPPLEPPPLVGEEGAPSTLESGLLSCASAGTRVEFDRRGRARRGEVGERAAPA